MGVHLPLCFLWRLLALHTRHHSVGMNGNWEWIAITAFCLNIFKNPKFVCNPQLTSSNFIWRWNKLQRSRISLDQVISNESVTNMKGIKKMYVRWMRDMLICNDSFSQVKERIQQYSRCPKRFLGTTNRNPSVSKSNPWHVVDLGASIVKWTKQVLRYMKVVVFLVKGL